MKFATLSEAERKAVAEADEWLKHNQAIPHEQVLAEFGPTMADWEQMAKDNDARRRPTNENVERRLLTHDSAARAQSHPETWAHPTQDDLNKILPGYFVKVGVAHPDLSGERFWGRVIEKIGAHFIIEVDQDMLYASLHGVKDEDTLIIGEENVFGIVDLNGAEAWKA